MVEKSKLDEDKKGKAVDLSHYHGIIGTLLYLTASRPDLQFAICMVSGLAYRKALTCGKKDLSIPTRNRQSGSMKDSILQAGNPVKEILLKLNLPDHSKYNRLRIMYTKFSELISHTGVTWNFETGKVKAHGDVWGAFTQRDKIFTTFKNRGCKHKLYALMDLVFSKSTAKGSFHNPSTSCPQTSEEERRIEDDYLGEESLVARKELSLAKSKIIKAQSSKGVEESTIDDCIILLDAIHDVSTTSYNSALTRFLDDGWRRMFVLMPDARRNAWFETLKD
nr:hypothetical protein [Tanacetum cinerariifolium]